jgi:hypothetical protein
MPAVFADRREGQYQRRQREVAEVTVTLEIDAKISNGTSEQIVRVVLVNGRGLGLPVAVGASGASDPRRLFRLKATATVSSRRGRRLEAGPRSTHLKSSPR